MQVESTTARTEDIVFIALIITIVCLVHAAYMLSIYNEKKMKDYFDEKFNELTIKSGGTEQDNIWNADY